MAHHLQKVLKAEVLCYKNVFYQDNGRGESSSSSSRRKKSEAKGSRDNSSHNVQPEAQRNLSHGDHHMADYDGSALPARIAPSASDHNGWNTGSHGHVSDRQHHHVGGRHAVDGHGNARKPVAPQHPHRKTIVAPKGTDLDQLANTISENFGDVDEYGFRIAGQHGRSPSSADRGKHTWRQTVRETVKLTTPVAQRLRDAADQQLKQPLALVLYDYIAEAEDDLPVLAGDIVRVIAVEGEWMYGMLLCASTQDVEESVFEYVPALVDGGHCLGWIPVSFTDNLGTGGDHGSGPAMF